MPNDIEFSQHALLKIDILKSHGINLSTEMIEDLIRFPDKIERGYKDRLVAQKSLDDVHVLRVIYETKPD